MNKSARIFLKEGTGAMQEYGKAIWGYIRDIVQVYQDKMKDAFVDNCNSQVVLVVDEFGEKALIACEDIEEIQYTDK